MNKRQKRGLILLAAGLFLVLGGLGLHLAQEQEDTAAGETAKVLLQQLDSGALVTQPSQENADPALPEKTYMGYSLIGSIRIPSVGIRLPVLNNWSEKMLKAAPCRYFGSISGGDMVIMGHNYKSHFTPLHKIKVGAAVEFADAEGKSYHYRVAKIEYLHRTEGALLPDENYPLTVFTCTPGGLNRIVVRCEMLE